MASEGETLAGADFLLRRNEKAPRRLRVPDFLILDKAFGSSQLHEGELTPEGKFRVNLWGHTDYQAAVLDILTPNRGSNRNLRKLTDTAKKLLSRRSPDYHDKPLNFNLPVTWEKRNGDTLTTKGFQANREQIMQLQQAVFTQLEAHSETIEPSQLAQARSAYQEVLRGKKSNKYRHLRLKPGDHRLMTQEITEKLAGNEETTTYLIIKHQLQCTRIAIAIKNDQGQWEPTENARLLAKLDLSEHGKDDLALRDAQYTPTSSLVSSGKFRDKNYRLNLQVSDEPRDKYWRQRYNPADPHQAKEATIHSQVDLKGAHTLKRLQHETYQWLQGHVDQTTDSSLVRRYQELGDHGEYQGVT